MGQETQTQSNQENKEQEKVVPVTGNNTAPEIIPNNNTSDANVTDIDALLDQHLADTRKKNETANPIEKKDEATSPGETEVEANGYDEPVTPDGKESNSIGEKVKAFLENKKRVATLITEGINVLSMFAFPWLYKKELFPNDELDNLPELEKKVVELEKEDDPKKTSEMMAVLKDIKAKQKELEEYSTNVVPLTPEEKEAITAVIEFKLKDSDLAKLIEDNPMMTLTIGLIGPRIAPIGAQKLKSWFS